MACRRGSLLLSAVLLAVGPGFIGFRRPTWRSPKPLRAAAVDLPPPPTEVSEGGGGEEYEIRFERDQIARQWLTLASEEDREVIEKQVLPFRSTQYFTGKYMHFYLCKYACAVLLF
eukprot:s396_g10.t1